MSYQFVQSSSLLVAWEKTFKDVPSVWASVTYIGDLDEAPGSRLLAWPNTGHCSQLDRGGAEEEPDPVDRRLSLFRCNTFKIIIKIGPSVVA